MSDQINSDNKVLAHLVREAGDPDVSPDPHYAATLKSMILARAAPAETVAHQAETAPEARVVTSVSWERTRKAKRVVKLAMAATILMALGVLASWLTIGGGSTNIAFADVAGALDNLRSATFDLTSEATTEDGKSTATATGKGYFLAPSLQRIETTIDIPVDPAIEAAAAAARRQHAGDRQAKEAAAKSAANAMAEAMALVPKTKITNITIADTQTGRSIMLVPSMKTARVMDMKKVYEEMKKASGGPPPDLFETVRRIVRDGSGGTGEKAKQLGKKVVDGHDAIGFWVRDAMNGMGDMTVWADPQSARPVRIELTGELGTKIHMVMNNFRYDIPLDRSLFSLEPPSGYSTQTVNVTVPTEEDLLRTLRTVAEHNHGMFPKRLSMNQEVIEAVVGKHLAAIPAMEKATQEKLDAEMEKIVAKYGGKEKLREKYGAQLPPEIMAELMKATMPLVQEQMQKQMREQTPSTGKELQGIQFYTSLKPENDPHYVGASVKLGTLDRPVLWYKPTGAEKYRVIYANLSIKELTLAEMEKLPEAKSN